MGGLLGTTWAPSGASWGPAKASQIMLGALLLFARYRVALKVASKVTPKVALTVALQADLKVAPKVASRVALEVALQVTPVKVAPCNPETTGEGTVLRELGEDIGSASCAGEETTNGPENQQTGADD